MRVSLPVVLVVLGLVWSLPLIPASSGDLLSGYGTATVDGVISPGEYDSCIGPIAQGGCLFTICETNDLNNDYYAVMISDLTNNPDDWAGFYFDDDNNGAVVPCGVGNVPPPEEDLMLAFGSGSPPSPGPDGHYCYNTAVGALYTTNGEASMNGGDVVKFTAGMGYVYEWWHPLSSGDSRDYSLSPGSTVGGCFNYLDRASGGGNLQYPAGCYTAARAGDASKYGLVVKKSPSTIIPSTTTTSTSGTTTSSTTAMGPSTVPGFPVESILAGLLGGLIAVTVIRRRRRL